MLTLKHLARDLDIDPYKLRCLLRRLFGKAKGRRWRWPSEDDKDYKRKRAAIERKLSHGT